MEANLGAIAPMPVADICAPLAQTVFYAYNNWEHQYNKDHTKILRGTKCPRQISKLNEYSKFLPKTLLIVGVRHPVLFFQSFWNQLTDNNWLKGKTPYDYMEQCVGHHCNNECPRHDILCLHRTRFHLPLATIGKTPLDDTERELLAPDDNDGGFKLKNHRIKNPIFLYEINQLNEDKTWADLTKLLKVPNIHTI